MNSITPIFIEYHYPPTDHCISVFLLGKPHGEQQSHCSHVGFISTILMVSLRITYIGTNPIWVLSLVSSKLYAWHTQIIRNEKPRFFPVHILYDICQTDLYGTLF